MKSETHNSNLNNYLILKKFNCNQGTEVSLKVTDTADTAPLHILRVGDCSDSGRENQMMNGATLLLIEHQTS